MSVRREITTARRRLLDARRAIETLLAHAPGSGKPGWDMLEELLRRGAEVAAGDGYPTQSMSDGDVHGGFGQRVGSSTLTERAALRLASEDDETAERHGRDVQPDRWEDHERDLAADLLRELVSDVARLALHADNIDNCRKVLLSIEGKGRRSDAAQPIGNCPLCAQMVTGIGEDRIKAGYCPACYSAWRRAGAPRDPVERGQFERARLAQLKREAEAADVSPPPRAVGFACEQGHLCCSVSAEHAHWHEPPTCPECSKARAAAKAG